MPSDFLLISYARRRRPQMSTLSMVPPSLRITVRNLSRLGATVRSSISGSRMTMSSYWCVTDPPPSDSNGHRPCAGDRRVLTIASPRRAETTCQVYTLDSVAELVEGTDDTTRALRQAQRPERLSDRKGSATGKAQRAAH